MDDLSNLARAVAETPPIVRVPQRVGLLPRLTAAMVDVVLLSLILLLCFFAISLVLYVDEKVLGARLVGGNDRLAYGSVMYAVVMLYLATEVAGGQTLGKHLAGIRVVRADGAAAGLGRLLRRWLLRRSAEIALGTVAAATVAAERLSTNWTFEAAWTGLFWLFVLVCVGSLLIMLPRRQALHDLLVGTAVFPEEQVIHVHDAGRAFEARPVATAASPTASPVDAEDFPR